jgi:hypothetical protein
VAARARIILLVLLAAAACAGTASRGGGAPRLDAASARDDEPAKDEETFGVRLESLRLSGGGTLLDLRYRVIHAEKARRIVHRNMAPYVELPGGPRLGVPRMAKIGALRQAPSTLEPQRVYFALFANPERAVKRGDRVRVVLGELERSVVVE